MNIDIIAGARPNFMKIGPIIDSLIKAKKTNKNLSFRLIHTGQHYDNNMSNTFFKELNIPEPNFNLNCGGGSQAEQTGKIMVAYENLLKTDSEKRDICIVVGDVTSTLACSIVAKKNGQKIAHVEAGLRSNDLNMPEEINRIVTDSITDYFFTTSEIANKNLINEGVLSEKLFFVGNTMIDTLIKNKNNFKKPKFWKEHSLKKNNYLVITIHRPSNVDNKDKLLQLINVISRNSNNKKIIFPVHPRTKQNLGFKTIIPNLILTDPMGYLEFMFLVDNSIAVITDSGGITEETTV